MEPSINPDKQRAPDNDVIYALRTAHQSQIQLNVMADQKANILVGTIAIFLTFLFTRVNANQITDQYLIIALSIVVVLELIALILGIMVIKPRTRWMNHSLNIEQMPNPLFFGFFSVFKENDFVDYMLDRLKDNRSARELLLKDLYQVGQVLKRKFTLLKFAYTFATLGIVFGVSSFAIILLPAALS